MNKATLIVALAGTALCTQLAAAQPARGPGGQRGGQQDGIRTPDAEQIMQRLDRNGDGVVTKDELPDERMWDRLSEADTDGDGQITTDELAEGMQRMREQARDRMQDRTGEREAPDPEQQARVWTFEANAIASHAGLPADRLEGFAEGYTEARRQIGEWMREAMQAENRREAMQQVSLRGKALIEKLAQDHADEEAVAERITKTLGFANARVDSDVAALLGTEADAAQKREAVILVTEFHAAQLDENGQPIRPEGERRRGRGPVENPAMAELNAKLQQVLGEEAFGAFQQARRGGMRGPGAPGAPGRPGRAAEDRLAQAFSRMDRDSDGFITETEARGAWRRIAEGDENGDGKVSQQEFVEAMRNFRGNRQGGPGRNRGGNGPI